MSPDRESRPSCGLVGSGPWVRLVQAPVLAAQRRVTFDRVWARNTVAAERLAEQFDLQVCRSHAELVESVDVVSYCVPPTVQAELAVEARRAGRRLLLEKPVAAGLDGARTLLDAGGSADRSVTHYSRLLNAELQRWLLDQAGGDFVRAEIVLTNDALLGDNPFAASPWRRAPNASLWDLGPHALSIAVAVLGPVASTRAAAQDGTVRLRLFHRSGAESVIVCSLTATAPQESIRLDGADGSVTAPSLVFDPDGSFNRAVDVLLDGPANRLDAAAADLRFSVHVVAVLEAAEASLLTAEETPVGYLVAES